MCIPKDAIAGMVNGIRDGDIIAAASTVAGLDVSHTGFAIWKDGELHLMHAPLTGSPVEISPAPARRADQGRSAASGASWSHASMMNGWLRPPGPHHAAHASA